ncbi:Membrane protein insertase YidC [compost metagenome]
MSKIAPEDKKIREKYKNDKQKMSEELTKLYSENKINPLGGCLPLLIQIPIILAMFYIVKEPLTYIIQTPQEEIKVYAQQLLNKEDVTKADMTNNEITIANNYGLIDMNFLGLNLGDVPSNVFSKDENKKSNPASLAIPVLSLVFSLIQTRQMQKSSTLTDEQKEMQKTTNLMLPVFSAIIAYTMPLALGVYWLIGNIIQIIQQEFINRVIKKDLAKDKSLNLKEGVEK